MANNTSLYSLAERLRKQLQSRLSTEAKVSMQEAILAIGSARDKIIQNKLYAQYHTDGHMVIQNLMSEYGYDEKLNPVWDADRELYSLRLPALPIELPKNSGIVDVRVKGQKDYSFIQSEPFNGTMYRGLAAATIPRAEFFQKGANIYFSEDSVGGKTNIILTMIASSSGINDRDTLPIDPDMEMDIIEMAKQTVLTPDKPVDVLNDGVGQ